MTIPQSAGTMWASSPTDGEGLKEKQSGQKGRCGKMIENEIMSAQVVFPDERTLDEVYADAIKTISELTSRIETLEAAAESAEA